MVTLSPSATPLPIRVKRKHLLSEKCVKSDNSFRGNKQRIFGVMAIIEILHYCGLPITDPAH